jgi:diaminopimelate epimerase
MRINFTKMHGLGNDFVVIDNRDSKLRSIQALSKKICDRRFGIGADQLILLSRSRTADFRMRIFNADGSEVEMCGKGNLFKVNMGEPVFDPGLVPVKVPVSSKASTGGRVFQYPLKIGNKTFKINCVSMGNPHAVIVVKEVKTVPLDVYGPEIERHRIFPNRTNVEFIQINSRKSITVKVWERGSGETLACGTGASASAVVSSLLGLTGRRVNVHLPGGKLIIEWSAKDNHVYMTGPAEEVFEGTIDI